jgi:hypothetical protein
MRLPKDTPATIENLSRLYKGKLMMREIALFACAEQSSIVVIFVVLVLRLSIPYLIRWWEHGNAFNEFNWDSWLYSILELLFGGFMVFINYCFVYIGFVDFQRRECMLMSCGILLDPLKTNHPPEMRQFPTINLLDVQSLHSWFQLRLCLMDLGLKYMSRIFIYSSTFLGGYFFYATVMLLQYFELINSLVLRRITNALAIYDILFTLGVILCMLHYGASANYQYVRD